MEGTLWASGSHSLKGLTNIAVSFSGCSLSFLERGKLCASLNLTVIKMCMVWVLLLLLLIVINTARLCFPAANFCRWILMVVVVVDFCCCFVWYFCCFVLFLVRVLLCSPGFPIDQASL